MWFRLYLGFLVLKVCKSFKMNLPRLKRIFGPSTRKTLIGLRIHLFLSEKMFKQQLMVGRIGIREGNLERTFIQFRKILNKPDKSIFFSGLFLNIDFDVLGIKIVKAGVFERLERSSMELRLFGEFVREIHFGSLELRFDFFFELLDILEEISLGGVFLGVLIIFHY